ncbi:MAG: hypothetical protein IJ438_09035 [Clostridia bacterium]|nr:hypothetical protein [Clostridia bacterium]
MPEIRPRTKDKRASRGVKMCLLTLLMLSASASTLLSGGPDTPQMMTVGEAAGVKRHGKTVMYVMDQAGLDLRSSDAEKLDQLNYSFALIKNGRADGSHWTGVRKVTSFLKKHPHIDGVLSVGGWGAEGFSDACATAEGRQLLADSILALMDEHGFVGVDIDWEYPGISGTGIKSRPEDVDNWYALLALLREGLDAREARQGREYILSVALGAGDQHIKAIDPSRLDKLLDQAVVMAYDLSGFDRQTGHHAGLYPGANKSGSGGKAVAALVEGGLSRDKILFGMPAYGRKWRQVTGGGNGLYQRAGTSGNKTISFDEVLRLEDQGYTRYYDEEAQAAWWFDGSSFISAEDDRSIAYKCDWVIDEGLQGVAVWQYTQDASGAMLAMLDAALTR